MSVRTYSPAVRVGNWNEDLALEEDMLKDFLEKREKGQLYIQQDTNLAARLNEKWELSISRDGYVHFGDVINLFCKEDTDRVVYSMDTKPRDACLLALDMSDSSKFSQKIEAPSPVSGTTKCRSVLRTAFVVKSADGSPDGTTLKYGEPFQLCTLPEAAGLYLQSDKQTFQNCTKKSRHQLVQLVAESSFLTHWKILHKNPQVRMEYEYAPVPANENVIITHCKTHRNLAVEQAYFLRTEFGTEYEISAHIYHNSHKAEEETNIWKIIMNQPGDKCHPVHVGDTTDNGPKTLTVTECEPRPVAPEETSYCSR